MQLDLFKAALDDNGINYRLDEPMKNHTSFKIGGAADVFINIQDKCELKTVLLLSKKYQIPYFILGRGSNILVSDNGIKGAVLSLYNMNKITIEGEAVTCEAGASLSQLCRTVRDNALSGLEFAYGIPGSVGGAVFMNAGAYGGEIKDVIKTVEYITPNGVIGEMELERMELSYRSSAFKSNNYIILSATFLLKRDEKDYISDRMDDYMNRRLEKQPLEYPSAGSTFKRPTGYFAGTLIENCGLKGVSIGGAMVSEKHAGFVINYCNATANDVKELIKLIEKRVYKENKVKLETEVIFVGE